MLKALSPNLTTFLDFNRGVFGPGAFDYAIPCFRVDTLCIVLLNLCFVVIFDHCKVVVFDRRHHSVLLLDVQFRDTLSSYQ